MRIVSLLPAATEIVAALGFSDDIVGVSHECNYPLEVAGKPRVTSSAIHGNRLSSAEIDRWVTESMSAGKALYTLDEELLKTLRPDLIITQQLCDVCAIDCGQVAKLAQGLPGKPRVITLSPSSLEDVFGDIARVAEALGSPGRGLELLERLRARVLGVQGEAAKARTRPICVQLEWIDPPFCGGHWNPELVEMAGGTDPIGRKGTPSVQVQWTDIVNAKPEVLLLACCGFDTRRILEDVPHVSARAEWPDIPAVRAARVYAINGNAYFARPGPRLVDSLEILAEIIHPELFAGRFAERGLVNVLKASPRHAELA